MKKPWLLLLLGIFTITVWAANPPTIVHLGTLPQVEVSDLQDLQLLKLDPSVSNAVYTANEDLCIYTSAARHNYGVTVESDNATHYQLHNGTTNLIVTLWWSPEAATESAQELTPNQTLLVENNSGSPQLNCPNGANANLQVRINSDQLINLPQGVYSETFNVMITPET